KGQDSRVHSRGELAGAGWDARYAITRSMTSGAETRSGLDLPEGRLLIRGSMERISSAPPRSNRIHGHHQESHPKHSIRGCWAELIGDKPARGHTNYACGLYESKACSHHAAAT